MFLNKISTPLKGALIFVVCNNFIFAQDQVTKFTADGNNSVFVSLEISEEKILLANSTLEAQISSKGDFFLDLNIFDVQNKELIKIPLDGLKDSLLHAVPNDIIKNDKTNEYVLVLQSVLRTTENNIRPNDYYALLILNEDFTIKQQIIRTIPNSEILLPQKLLSINDSTLLVVGSNRVINTGFANNWFIDEFINYQLSNSVITIDSIQSEKFLGYLINSINKVDISQYYLTSDVSIFGTNDEPLIYSFSTNNYEIKKVLGSLPFSSESFALASGEQSPSYKYAPNNIYTVNSDTLVSDIVYQRAWIDIRGNLYDTATVGLFFYTKALDSLKFVELSLEHGILISTVSDLDKKENSNYCFVGTMNQEEGTGNTPLDEFLSGIVAMVDDTGKVLWNYQIAEDETNLFLTEAIATSDGGCIFAGSWFKEGVSNDRDIIVISLDSMGTLTSISDESLAHLFDKQRIAVYPNPAKSQGQVNLSWSGMASQSWQLNMYDSQGRIVFGTAINQGNTQSQITVPQLPKGSYILRATGSSKQVHTGTLLVE